MFVKLALRDAGILGMTVLLWFLFSGYSAGNDYLSDFLGVVVGLAVAACAYLLHEWGHALGGLATRSAIHPAASLKNISLFSFDSKRNSRAQFAVMSLSGFAVTAAVIYALYTQLPDELLATRVARGAALISAALTVFLEVPILVIGLVRGKIPPVETFEISRVGADDPT